MDLRDLWRRGGRLTWRRLGVLIAGLPATSRVHTQLRDTVEVDEADEDTPPSFGPWDTTNYQLATLIDVMQNLIRTVIEVQGGTVNGQVEPVPRPQMRVRKRLTADDERVIDELEAIRERHRRESGLS